MTVGPVRYGDRRQCVRQCLVVADGFDVGGAEKDLDKAWRESHLDREQTAKSTGKKRRQVAG
jgi:hypothetical protein